MGTYDKNETTSIDVTDYGLSPNTGENAVHAVRKCVEALRRIKGPCVLEFPAGQYDFYPCEVAKEKYFISNTTTEEENPDITKTIGLLFKGNKNLTVEGNGSVFMFHGKMTMFTFDACENIEIRNVHTDFVRPTISEMTVTKIDKNELEVRVHSDSWYTVENGSLCWEGEGWEYRDGPAQKLDPDQNVVERVPNPIHDATKVEELEPGLLRLYYDQVPKAKIGHVYQVRDGVRDQVGALILHSNHVTFDHVHLHYMHGLGIVGQFSENLLFNNVNLSPRAKTKRTAAVFADFMHMSGCKGKITILNSNFEGAHDDAVNIHGTHLRIVGQPEPNQMLVRFMHGQTYGFDAFFPGDDIALLQTNTLATYGENKVNQATLLNPREILLTLVHPVCDGVEIGDVVENLSWTPEVIISNNRFSRIPTRGILMTTPRKAVIKDNTFVQTFMSGILVACDAENWYESGRVNDLNIIGNKFINSGFGGDPVIYINPENTAFHPDCAVHQNIRIEDNDFLMCANSVLDIKSTHHLSFHNNRIEGSSPVKEQNNVPLIYLLASSDINMTENKIKNNNKDVVLHHMSQDKWSCSAEQGLHVTVCEEKG